MSTATGQGVAPGAIVLGVMVAPETRVGARLGVQLGAGLRVTCTHGNTKECRIQKQQRSQQQHCLLGWLRRTHINSTCIRNGRVDVLPTRTLDPRLHRRCTEVKKRFHNRFFFLWEPCTPNTPHGTASPFRTFSFSRSDALPHMQDRHFPNTVLPQYSICTCPADIAASRWQENNCMESRRMDG